MTKLRCSLVLGSAVMLGACASPRTQTSPRVTSPPTVVDADKALLQKIAHYHWEAQRMTQSCKEQTRRPELLDLCNTLLLEHQQALQEVMRMLQEWYGQTLQLERSPEHASEQYRVFRDEMSSSSGEKFEEAFLRAMRVHHRLGAQDARACRNQARRQELRAFCEKQAVGHEQELRTLNDLICKWFRDCVEAGGKRE